MKHFSKFAVLALACSLWSCSDDAPANDSGKQNGNGDFFAKITLKLPTVEGSRASTVTPTDPDPAKSSDGYEFGKDSENKVNNVTIVLATKTPSGDYTLVTSANGTPLQDDGSQGGSTTTPQAPTFVMSFDAASLQNHVGETLYMFAYCNQTPAEVNDFDAKGKISNGSLNATTTPIAISIAQPNNFLMTNSSVVEVTLPAWNTLMSQHNTVGNPYSLGTIPVERVACRFDFQPTTKQGAPGPNQYPIYEQPSASDDVPGTGLYGYIELKEMALFNEAQEFYYLRHISNSGTTVGMTICTPELPDNFVVGPNCDDYLTYNQNCIKNGEAPLSPELESKFFFPMRTIASTANWTKITDLKEDDTHSSTQSHTWTFDGTDYKIWRYATENPIPSDRAQRHGITTGVVFKGELTPLASPTTPVGTTLKAAMTAKSTIYAYRESTKESSKSNLTTIFGSAMDLYTYCKNHAGTNPRKDFVKAVQNGVITVTASPAINAATATDDDIFGENVNVSAVSSKESNAALKPYHFICYVPTTEGGATHYYTYYYYFNRHNDNGLDYQMGRMEFATVRNNIYKLSVETVSAPGLPQDTPPDPWTPDENPQVYFKVSVKVLDWVVRKNSIKF